MTELIERELDLNAAPEDVWRAVTDPAWLAGWLADEAMLEPWPGGDARFTTAGEVRHGWVEEVSPPACASDRCGRLAFWWQLDGEPASRVEFVLEPRDGGTRLRVVETRPLELLDLVGIPLGGQGGRHFGPALVAA